MQFVTFWNHLFVQPLKNFNHTVSWLFHFKSIVVVYRANITKTVYGPNCICSSDLSLTWKIWRKMNQLKIKRPLKHLRNESYTCKEKSYCPGKHEVSFGLFEHFLQANRQRTIASATSHALVKKQCLLVLYLPTYRNWFNYVPSKQKHYPVLKLTKIILIS